VLGEEEKEEKGRREGRKEGKEGGGGGGGENIFHKEKKFVRHISDKAKRVFEREGGREKERERERERDGRDGL
jgi:hypothetical protein